MDNRVRVMVNRFPQILTNFFLVKSATQYYQYSRYYCLTFKLINLSRLHDTCILFHYTVDAMPFTIFELYIKCTLEHDLDILNG